MSKARGRIQILKRIAGADISTHKFDPVSGQATPLQVTVFPNIAAAWGANNLPYLQRLLDILNRSIYVLSAKIDRPTDFDKLRHQNFNTDLSPYYGDTLQGVLKVAKLVFNTVFTQHGNNLPLQPFTDQQKKDIIGKIDQGVNAFGIPDGTVDLVLRDRNDGELKQQLSQILGQIK